MRWSRVEQSPDTTLAYQQNGCLEINPVKFNSDGDYICQARNRFGIAETTTTVIVTMKSWVYFILYPHNRFKQNVLFSISKLKAEKKPDDCNNLRAVQTLNVQQECNWNKTLFETV